MGDRCPVARRSAACASVCRPARDACVSSHAVVASRGLGRLLALGSGSAGHVRELSFSDVGGVLAAPGSIAFSFTGTCAPVTVGVAMSVGALPLVGRETELGVLERALEAVGAGRSWVVGLVGEPGIGK